MNKRLHWAILLAGAAGCSFAWSSGLFSRWFSPPEAETNVTHVVSARTEGRSESDVPRSAASEDATAEAKDEIADPVVRGDNYRPLSVEELADLECPSDNNNPDPGDPPPGLWWNPKRWGTGWTFAYKDESQKLQLVWHTYYPFYPTGSRGQTWLMSDWAQVTMGGNGLRTWHSDLFRPHYGVWSREKVGEVKLDFFGDSATRAKVTWRWYNQWGDESTGNIDVSGTECLYSFFLDGPPSGAPTLVDPPQQTAPAVGTPSDQYTGIWHDQSVPGYILEVAMGTRPDYTEADTISIYDEAGQPLWLQGLFMDTQGWPSPAWQQTQLIYRTAEYSIVNGNCTSGACVNTQTLDGTNFIAREYHSLDRGVMEVKATLSSANLNWPPANIVNSTGDISPCLHGLQRCRAIERASDFENLYAVPSVCTPDATDTCKIRVSWHASPIAVVERVDPVTHALIEHGDDHGVVGGGVLGEVQDTLANDERVLYRLMIGTRPNAVITRSARAEKSHVDAPSYCVIPVGQTQCSVTVEWASPLSGNTLRLLRYSSMNGGAYQAPTSLNIGGLASGSMSDGIVSGETVYYELKTTTGAWLDSTSSDPTSALRAHITVDANACSIPLGESACPVNYTFQASAPNARLFRKNTAIPNDPGVQVGSEMPSDHGAGTFYVPLGNYRYVVMVGSAEEASSDIVTGMYSQLHVAIGGGTLDAPAQCIVFAGHTTCDPIHIWWTSTPQAVIYRVDEIAQTRFQIGQNGSGDAYESPELGAQLHYELTIGGFLHAITPTITAISDNEGGDSTDSTADPAPFPGPFSTPSLDTASDQVGAIAGEFRVDESGNSIYRIPLAVPPGAGGLSPTLAVTYSSSLGDSVLGTGFTLEGVSAVTPCRRSVEAGDTGDPNPVPSELCLDGQRLLLVNGAHKQVGAEYRTELESFQRITLTAIESQVIAGAARSAFVFKVEAKDGSVRMFGGIKGTVFGQGASSPATPNTGVQAQAWLLTQLSDVANNNISFTYTDVNTLGERNLLGVSYRGGSVVFTYTDSTRADVSYSSIGARKQSKLLSSIDIKNDAGVLLRHYEPTYNTSYGNWQRFRPHLLSLKECASQAGPCYPPTVFDWNDAAVDVQTSHGDMPGGLYFSEAGDVDGDKRADLWWTSNASAGGAGNQLHISSFNIVSQQMQVDYNAPFLLPDGFEHGGLWEVIDINGDGRDDLLYAWPNSNGAGSIRPNQLTWLYRLSIGKEFGPEQVLFTVPVSQQLVDEASAELAAQRTLDPSIPQSVQLAGSSMVMDVNGDGLPDLVFRAPDTQFWVALTKRTGNASAPYSFTTIKARFEKDGAPATDRCIATANLFRKEENFSQATDFDGDGRADIRFMIDARNCIGGGSGYRLDTFLSKGFNSTDNVFVFKYELPFGSAFTTTADTIGKAAEKIRTVDVNGDGLTDLVYPDGSGVWRYRLGGPFSLTTDACASNCALLNQAKYVQLLDFDGDGKLDFWMRNGDNYQVFLWTGSNWATQGFQTAYGTSGDHWDEWYRAPADYDGDGTTDTLIVRTGGSSDGSWYLERRANHHSPRGVIVQITNGLGAKTTIDYAPLTYSSVHRPDYDGPFTISGRRSPVMDVAAPSYVVRKVRSSAPAKDAPNNESSVLYRYAGLKVQGGGRGSLGFRRVSTLDPQTLIEVDSYYTQRFPLTGLAEFTETRKIHSTWSDACAAGGDTVGCLKYMAPCSSGLNSVCDDDLPEINNSAATIKESADQWQWRAGNAVGALEPGCVLSGTSLFPPDPQRYPTTSCRTGEPASEGEIDGQALLGIQAPIFLGRIETLASDYDFATGASSAPIRTESTKFPLDQYDAYGNPKASTTVVTSGSTADESTTVTTSSFFKYADVVGWKLGRLTEAKVQTQRTTSSGTTTNARMSSFTYGTNGLLASEKVEGITGSFPSGTSVDSAAPAAAKYYTYDTSGNRTITAVCSTDIGETTCRNATVPSGKYDFHPIGKSVMRYTKVSYDSLQRLPETTTEVFWSSSNAPRELIVSKVLARADGGDPTEIQDINQVTAKIRYGTLGRKRFTWAQTGDWTQWDARYCAGATAPPDMPTTSCPSGLALAYRAVARKAGAPTNYTFYDVLGRPVVSVTEGFQSGDWIAAVTKYDARGNIIWQSDPYFVQNADAGAASPRDGLVKVAWTETQYDALNRPTQVRHTGNGATTNDDATTTIDYNGLTTTTKLPANASGNVQTRTEVRNGLGEVIRTIDANGFDVRTYYDAAGNPTLVDRGSGTTTMFMYDSLGRRKTLTDADANGSWSYEVNGVGEVISQKSPRGKCTTSEWDGRGRVWRRRDYAAYTGTSCTSLETEGTWTYDSASYGAGALGQETNGQVTRSFAYDSLGRTISATTTVDSKNYLDEWTFDQVGRPFQHFFLPPGMPKTGEQNVYTTNGYLWQVVSAFDLHDGTPLVYREIRDMDARGHVTEERTAALAAYTSERKYNNYTGRLEWLLTTSAGAELQNITYAYDRVGNVKSQSIRGQTTIATETFGYDKMQRLLTADVSSGGAITFSRSQTYDTQGNFLTKNGASYTYHTQPTGCSTAEYPLPGPHAVTEANGVRLCYDKNGNVAKQTNGLGNDKVFTYTAADQVSDITDRLTGNGMRVGFKYGPNRERVKRLDYLSADAGTANTVVQTVGGAEIRYSADGSNNASALQEVRRHIGNIIVVQSGSQQNYRIKRQILLTDAQGSTHRVLGAMSLQSTAGAAPTSFDAWGLRRDGETLGSPTPWSSSLESLLRQTTTHGYTGHEMAESVGIVHMNGRIYDPTLARFLQPDPVVQDPGNSQNWNPYSYVFNNPLAYTDPTGNWGAQQQQYLRTVVAIVITVYTGGVAAAYATAGATAQAWGVAIVGGFAAGAVQTGTLRGAAVGAVSAAAFYGVGSYFENADWAQAGASNEALGSGLSYSGYAAKALSHGVVGGVMAELQGGRFGHGFASAGFGEAVSPVTARMGSTPARAVAITVVGGTASVLAGGKFANGATTAAFGFAFNELLHPSDMDYRLSGAHMPPAGTGPNFGEWLLAEALCGLCDLNYRAPFDSGALQPVGSPLDWLVPTRGLLGGLEGAAVKTIDPAVVRFSQSSIARNFRSGGTIEDLAEGLRNGSVNPANIPPIRLVGREGNLFTLDNRRLWSFQQAEVQIPYRMATPQEAAEEAWKFSTQNEGASIRVRGK